MFSSSKLDTGSNSPITKFEIKTQEVTPVSYKNNKNCDPNETLSDISHDNHTEIEIQEFRINYNFNNTICNNMVLSSNNNNGNIENSNNDFKIDFKLDFDDNFSCSNDDYINSNENFELKWFDVHCQNDY